MFLQVIGGHRAEAYDPAMVYYNVGRGNVDIVYYNVPGSDAEAAGPSEETDYHLYEEIDQRDVPREEAEYHQYEDVDLQGGAEAARRSRIPPVYEVDL